MCGIYHAPWPDKSAVLHLKTLRSSLERIKSRWPLKLMMLQSRAFIGSPRREYRQCVINVKIPLKYIISFVPESKPSPNSAIIIASLVYKPDLSLTRAERGSGNTAPLYPLRGMFQRLMTSYLTASRGGQKKAELIAIVYSATTTVGGMSTGIVHIMKIISRVKRNSFSM